MKYVELRQIILALRVFLGCFCCGDGFYVKIVLFFGGFFVLFLMACFELEDGTC